MTNDDDRPTVPAPVCDWSRCILHDEELSPQGKCVSCMLSNDGTYKEWVDDKRVHWAIALDVSLSALKTPLLPRELHSKPVAFIDLVGETRTEFVDAYEALVPLAETIRVRR